MLIATIVTPSLAQTGYLIVTKDGQQCLAHLLQTPVWEHGGLYYALLAVGLAILWLLAMLCTYSSRCLRRCLYTLGLGAFALLAALAGWHITGLALMSGTGTGGPAFAELLTLWPFDANALADSDIWFAALVQVIGSTGIGVGVWPVLTGKFLYKGDAVRTSMVYMCFNVCVCSLAVGFFATQFSAPQSLNATITMAELNPLTAIYDAAANEPDAMLARLQPGLAYALIVLCALLTMATAIYTASRFVGRHPNYTLSLLGLVTATCALLGPRYIVARVLDAPVVGVFAICALIFDIMSITWIYGAKNIYTDLEFSIGRPILKTWVLMWCITPVLLAGVLAWWASSFGAGLDLQFAVLPRWSPIVLALALVALVACVQVYDQVGYNCCSMIQEAAHSSTDWGPADPIVRHAWKQWRSVCEDTGQKDFTLRRRGTRDYTHSIKKGQYSRAKYGSGIGGGLGMGGAGGGGGGMVGIGAIGSSAGGKSSSVGSNTPNYSGSVFEDSAIEEDVSVEKFAVGGSRSRGGSLPSQQQQQPPQLPISYADYAVDVRHKTPQQPDADRTGQHLQSQKQYFYVQPAAVAVPSVSSTAYAGEPAAHQQYHSVSKIEIVPDAGGGVHHTHQQLPQFGDRSRPFAKNPLGRMATATAAGGGGAVAYGGGRGGGGFGGAGERIAVNATSSPYASRRANAYHTDAETTAAGADHICWRKFSVNSQEFSTEL